MSDRIDEFDLVIVGAGPGGIAAATVAAERNLRVALIDDNPFPGGQIWRNRGNVKNAQAKKWLTRLQGCAQSIVGLQQSRVIARPDGHQLLVETPDGARRLKWKSLILATGSRELFLPFPGWTLPGVIGAGGIQALVKQGLDVNGKRIVVAGSGPLLLAVADLLRSSGAHVPVIIEQAPAGKINAFGFSLLRTPGKLLAGIGLRARLLGTRYATSCYPTAVTKQDNRLRVEYTDGRENQTVDCDFLACGFGLIPNNELPQLLHCEIMPDGFVRVDSSLRTSVKDVYAIGELTGIGGVDKAILEGQIAALTIAGDSSAAARLSSHHTSANDFTRRLAEAFALRSELFQLAKSNTLVCRCEDIPLSALAGSTKSRDAKLQTRCGMGPCQGRVCGPILQRLIHGEAPQVRPPVLACRVSSLCSDAKVGST